MTELTAEEREEIGGAAVAVPYAVPWSAVLGELLVVAPLLWVVGAAASALEPGGPPWHTLDARELVTRPVLVLCGLLLAVGASRVSLLLWRRSCKSPGLVAGPLGVRVHGTWLSSSFHRWGEVLQLDVEPDQLVVVLRRPAERGARLLRTLRDLAGSPRTVPTAGVDPAELAGVLARLRQPDTA